MPTTSATLYYVHDPMCSWCWGFRHSWLEVKRQLPATMKLISLVGGLAPDSDVPMEQSMRSMLQSTWKRIQQQIPGTEFNFDFWTQNTPRRSTYPACRAVIAARELAGLQDEMTYGIQQAYYLNAQNPSDLTTLSNIAVDIGLDIEAFETLMQSDRINDLLQADFQQRRDIGVDSFPSLVLETNNRLHGIAIDYCSPMKILDQIHSVTNPTQA